MKTQLFLDLQESGSAPELPKRPPPAAAPPSAPAARSAPDDSAVPRRRPAVWHGPGAQHADMDAAMQRADAGTMQRAPDTAARGLGVAIESWADRAARPGPAAPGAAPRMPRRDRAIDAETATAQPERQIHMPSPPAPVQARDHAGPDAADVPRPGTLPHSRVDAGPAARPEPFAAPATLLRAPTADDAYWHARRRRAGPGQRRAAAWNRFWPRRLAAWSIAGGLLAGLAAGGFWLYQNYRGDGPPAVAAAPVPARSASTPIAGSSPATPQPVAPASAPAVHSAPATDIVRPVPDPAPAAAVPAPPAPVDVERTVKTVETAPTPAADVEPPRRAARQSATARKRPAPKTLPARTHDTARQRREELQMQCRAHGYDERLCFQRACTMTRYGLVCRG